MTPPPDRADTIEAHTVEPSQLASCIHASACGGEAVITLRGEVDLATAVQLRDVFEAAQRLAPLVVLDLAGVTFLDSSGIKEIVRARRRADVRMRVASPSVRRCLDVCGLTDLLLEA